MPTFTCIVEIDWDGSGTFDGGNETVTGDVLAIGVRRGRSAVNSEVSPGSCSLTLLNTSGLYSPFNSSSAIYGSVKPGRALRVRVTDSAATTHAMFYGYITSFAESLTPSGVNIVSIQALDAFDLLRFGSIRLSLQESQRPDQLITTILDAISWPAGLRSLGTALSTVAQFWQHRATPIAALKEAAKSEPGGEFYISRAGEVTFANRLARSSRSSSFTITNMKDIAVELRREDLYDEVHHTRAGLTTDTSNTTLFTDTPGKRAIQPGSAAAQNTIHGQLTVGGKSLVSPVATTDYTANSAADGSGTDKTAQLTVSSFTSYGGGFSITWANADSSPVYLRGPGAADGFQIRGLAVRQSNDERRIEVAVASPVISDQVLSDTWQYLDDVDAISGYAHYRAATFANLLPRPVISRRMATNAETALFLALELGHVIRITNTSGLYPSQINDLFYVEQISWDIKPGVDAVCQLTCFHRDLAGGSMFRISGAAGGGADYSLISTAGATTGYDRIGW